MWKEQFLIGSLACFRATGWSNYAQWCGYQRHWFGHLTRSHGFGAAGWDFDALKLIGLVGCINVSLMMLHDLGICIL